MVGFPYYLAPFQKWLTQKLKDRAANQNLSNKLMPFAMLSSAAVVKKGSGKKLIDRKNEVVDLIAKGTGDYNGCVITNTVDIKNLYRTGTLIAGYDLNGEEIVVEGSLDSRVSVPIIESIEIDTDGANNTLKTARVNVRVFTLKQLEMFELFFLRPSMNVVLEFGYNDGFDIQNQNDIKTNLFFKKKFEDYKTAYKKIYSSKDYITQREEYKKIIKDTKGNYEYMPGKVTNFTISLNADLTYSIMIEVSSGNELQLWFPLNQAKAKGEALIQKADKNITEYQRWVQKLAAETGRSEFIKTFEDENKYKNEFFNWGIRNDSAKDQSYSKTSYISFSLILDIINNSSFAKDSKTTIDKIFKINEKESIPISSTKYIISTSDELIIPGDIAKIEVKKSAANEDEIVITDTTISAEINNKKFNYSNSDKPAKLEVKTIDGKPADVTIPDSVGNLLNIFIKYDTFINMYTSAYSLAELMNQLLDLINNNMFGLCNLQLCKITDGNSPTNLTIIDTKMQCYPTNGQDETEEYRFKVGTKESIVLEMNFSTELSVLQQAQALYSTQLLAISAENKGKVDPKIKQIPYTQETEYADFSFARNTDGYYSLNILEYEIVKEQNDIAKKIQEDTKSQTKPATPVADKVDKTKIRQDKFIRFKDTPNAELIYMDPALVQAKIAIPAEETTVLSSMEISLTIDGTSGISSGEYFRIEGIPEIYNENGVFQVLNVKHTLNESGWRTIIEAGFRYTN